MEVRSRRRIEKFKRDENLSEHDTHKNIERWNQKETAITGQKGMQKKSK